MLSSVHIRWHTFKELARLKNPDYTYSLGLSYLNTYRNTVKSGKESIQILTWPDHVKRTGNCRSTIDEG